MSNDNIPIYKFKPFQFTVLKKNNDPLKRPLARSGHRVVCNNSYLFSYGGFNPQTNNANGRIVSSTMRELWKYCFDFGEWKIISCKDVPQELASSSVTLSGNIIIIYGGTGVPFGAFCSNRMYLGNLANEYTENGMKFEELNVSGDVPMPLYGQGVVMDGKYIYSIGGTSGYEYEMDVHRLDLSTRKWELLHKSHGGQEPEPRYRHEVVFYKGRIYIFGGGRGGATNVYYGFSKIHMFDLATKQWECVQAIQDSRVPRPGYPNNRSCHSCVQCPEKSNLVYICGGFDGYQSFRDVWRFDLDTSQWEKLTRCTMPQPVYFHSSAVTPSGRMCCYGGIVSLENRDGSGGRSNDITSAWILIPKLKVIAWEAMVHYFKDQMFESSDEHLKKIGLPQEYYQRVIEARRTNTFKN